MPLDMSEAFTKALQQHLLDLRCQMFTVQSDFFFFFVINQRYQKISLTHRRVNKLVSLSLCDKHESSSSGPTPWKPFNIILPCFYQQELSLYSQRVNHQRHSLYYSPLKSFEFQCQTRAVHGRGGRLNGGGKMFTAGSTLR